MTKSSVAETGMHTGVITVPRVRGPFLKRPLDIMLSTFMLIVSLPVSVLIALAIKMEDSGPILYRQKGDPGIYWNVLMIERTSKIGRVV
jgi:lipopolysaccharide/colanic/teichoic acid biosynthesis glycosyltransferase